MIVPGSCEPSEMNTPKAEREGLGSERKDWSIRVPGETIKKRFQHLKDRFGVRLAVGAVMCEGLSPTIQPRVCAPCLQPVSLLPTPGSPFSQFPPLADPTSSRRLSAMSLDTERQAFLPLDAGLTVGKSTSDFLSLILVGPGLLSLGQSHTLFTSFSP